MAPLLARGVGRPGSRPRIPAVTGDAKTGVAGTRVPQCGGFGAVHPLPCHQHPHRVAGRDGPSRPASAVARCRAPLGRPGSVSLRPYGVPAADECPRPSLRIRSEPSSTPPRPVHTAPVCRASRAMPRASSSTSSAWTAGRIDAQSNARVHEVAGGADDGHGLVFGEPPTAAWVRVSPAASAARAPRFWRRYGCGGAAATVRVGGPGGWSGGARRAAVAR